MFAIDIALFQDDWIKKVPHKLTGIQNFIAFLVHVLA